MMKMAHSTTRNHMISNKRKSDSSKVIEKYINYHFKDIKASEVKSRLEIEFLQDSNFNMLLKYYNEFILMTTKRIDSDYDIDHVRTLWRLMDAPKPRITFDSDFVSDVKDRMFESLMYHINLSNGLYSDGHYLSAKPHFQKKTNFKAYVCKGNNGNIIKTILKKRWWWTIVDRWDTDQCDFIWTQWFKIKVSKSIEQSTQTAINNMTSSQLKSKESEEGFTQSWVYGKVSQNYHLTNKKNLFINMKRYYLAIGKDPNDFIPMTFLITGGAGGESFQRFLQETKTLHKSTVWICLFIETCWIIKPGENTNRGRGIKLCNNITELSKLIDKHKRSSYIIQKYKHTLLINKRKFDLRIFALFTNINGHRKAYFFQEGYLRTASKEFTTKNLSNRFIHLTNDAVQK